MFIIDFSATGADILQNISNRDTPAWAIPVFDFIRSWFDKDVDSFEVQTSGSTGTPKVIQHSRRAMIASAQRTCDFFELQNGDVAILALPATHIGGKMMIVRSIIKGLQLICTEPTSNPLVHLDHHNEIQFAAFTPMQMSIILDNGISLGRLSQIKKVILGGGEVSYSLRQKLQSIPAAVYETYGMTETISHIALKKINGPGRSDYFTTLEGTGIKIDEKDCLVIEAHHLSDQKIVTNDIVKIISPTTFQWLGRYDNIINTGGIKVSAEEIERKLQPHIATNFFITGIADEVLGQRVTLLLEANSNTGLAQVNFDKVLSKYEKPREVLAIEKFSYTPNGKINKQETIKRLH